MRGFQWLYREGGSEVQYLRCCNRTAVATPAVPLTRAGTHIIPRLMEDSCPKTRRKCTAFRPVCGQLLQARRFICLLCLQACAPILGTFVQFVQWFRGNFARMHSQQRIFPLRRLWRKGVEMYPCALRGASEGEYGGRFPRNLTNLTHEGRCQVSRRVARQNLLYTL